MLFLAELDDSSSPTLRGGALAGVCSVANASLLKRSSYASLLAGEPQWAERPLEEAILDRAGSDVPFADYQSVPGSFE